MSRSSLAPRLAPLFATVASVALLLAHPAGPVAASGPGIAPLLDGERPAPQRVTVRRYALLAAEGPARARDARGQDARGKVARGKVARGGDVRPSGPAVPASREPCLDRAWKPRLAASGYVRWTETYRWSYRARGTPRSIGKRATERALVRSAGNITSARNDCGRPDRVLATTIYQGRTENRPAPTATGACAARDGVNVVGFGRLPPGIAGLTCVWSVGDQIIEADIKLDRDAAWAVSLAGCSFASLVEAVATHEFGHVFGLGHVSESRHGRLTMSERLDGYCQLNEATLGLGDMLGLESRY